MIYILDTTALSDILKQDAAVLRRTEHSMGDGDEIFLCSAAYYEISRGLIRRNAVTQLKRLREEVVPQFDWTSVLDEDWLQAARF